MNRITAFGLCLLLLLLSACSKVGLEQDPHVAIRGTYALLTGMRSKNAGPKSEPLHYIELRKNNRFTFKLMGGARSGNYRFDGEHVYLEFSSGQVEKYALKDNKLVYKGKNMNMLAYTFKKLDP